MIQHLRTAGAILAFGLLAGCASLSAEAPAPRAEFSADRLSEHVRVLASDEYGGRAPATEGEVLTLAYLQAHYEALGLEPGGPDGAWLQPVDLRRYVPAAPATAAWTGPDGAPAALSAEHGLLLRAALNDGRAEIGDAPLVFAGYGVTAPERGWDDYGDADVRGAVVLVVAGEPAGALFNGEFPTLYAGQDYKEAEAFRRGAVGLLVLAADDDAAWARRVAGNGRPDTIAPGRDHLEFTGRVREPLAMRWLGAAGQNLAGLRAGLDSGGFRAVRLQDVRLSVSATETVETVRTHNLLARIPGRERPGETVIFSAHWDHVGRRDTPDERGDTVYNGAWDNASGTAGVLEMARVLAAGPQPRRTLVFAHMTAEEMGLLGAYAYVADPVYPLETTVADLNIDMLPLSGPTLDVPIFGLGQNTLEDDLQALAAEQGRYVSDDGQPEQGFYYRSDHFPFALAGVPALMPWHGVDLVEGGREVGLPAYRAQFRAHYHQRSDEWRPDMDFRSAVENLELLRRLAEDLANSDRWPEWKPGSEFAATRATSAAARAEAGR